MDAYKIYDGIDAEFVQGYRDGRDLSTPPPSENRHPAYRHSWEVGRAEVEGSPIPCRLSWPRVEHIEAGGDFYHVLWPRRPSQQHNRKGY